MRNSSPRPRTGVRRWTSHRGAVLLLALSLGWGANLAAQAERPAPRTGPWTQIVNTAGRLVHGTEEAPATAARHWRRVVPFALGVGLLIAYGDQPLSARIQSPRLEATSRVWSDRGLTMVEPAIIWALAAHENRCWLCPRVRDLIWVELGSAAYATAEVQSLKLGFDRERPNVPFDGDGSFRGGGSSFPSGHAIAAFTMASVLAERNPRDRWAAWVAYASASTVAGLRYTAKLHFPSDLAVGGTLGVLTGTCAVHCR